MCGIVGIIDQSISATPRPSLRRMAAEIEHRGPDDEGYFETSTRDGRNYIGLGHRRLSIIDLSSGRQPISNEDGTIQIVFNGEIYNYKSLRETLIARGHRFETNSDTETIVHAYEEYGIECVTHFRGMFAFAIWDGRHDRLILARDRFGKKPLFIRHHLGKLLFASEIKSILACPDVAAEVDLDAVWDYLTFRYVPGPATLFQDIRKLPPGSLAVWENGELCESAYYVPPDREPFGRLPPFGNPVDTFLELLEEAVKIRMVSDVPFGAFLSGGLDSSAIIALMTRHSRLPVKTFSVGFTDSAYSELNYARGVAQQFRTEHRELIVSQNDLMENLARLVRYRDAPVSEPSDIPIYLLAKEARRTVKMVLTGEGSDEFLGGYPKHVFERYVAWYQLFPKAMRRLLFEPLVHALPYRFRRAKTAVHNLGLDQQNRMPRWFGALSFEERAELAVFRPSVNHMEPSFETSPKNSRLRRILYFDQTSWLPDNLLERGDRMTMAASIEARMPFIDHQLAEYVSSLPDRYRVRGNRTKWILREAMKQLLPPSILARPKVGFRVPVNDWFRGPMRDFVYDHLSATSSKTAHYYNRSILQRLLSEHVNGLQNHEKILWTLLNLEIWHRQYLAS